MNDILLPVGLTCLILESIVCYWLLGYYRNRYERERNITDMLTAMLERRGAVVEIERTVDSYGVVCRYPEPSESIDNKPVSE